jgi:hypothetical protein
MKNGVFWDVTPVALVRTDVSEELSASFIRVTRIGELETTVAVTSNRRRGYKMCVMVTNYINLMLLRAMQSLHRGNGLCPPRMSKYRHLPEVRGIATRCILCGNSSLTSPHCHLYRRPSRYTLIMRVYSPCALRTDLHATSTAPANSSHVPFTCPPPPPGNCSSEVEAYPCTITRSS